jgi:hypothetical protein
MKKIGVFVVVMAMACLFAGAASAEMHVEGNLGGAVADNSGQATTIKELPDTGENYVTQFRHPQTLPLISPPHDPPADTDFKSFKQREEPLPDPEFM